MSGHSKWSKIQHKKGKTDSARSNLFTKLSRAITIAASQGGGDPEMNFGLRLAIQKGKEGNLPKDNIERAIKKGTGELAGGVVLEEVTYEGFGPCGVAFLVEAVTDNKNRTVSEIKHAFSKYGGSLGGPGSVQWQFERFGVARLLNEHKEKVGDKWPDFELALMDVGVNDIIDNEFGVELHCPINNFQKVLEVVESYNIELDDSGLEWIAKEEVDLNEAEAKRVENLYEELDGLEDVKAVYTN